MAYGLEDFCSNAHDALLADSGHDGRERVRQHLEALLANQAFVAGYLANAAAGKEILHHDPETGFYVMVHGSDDYDRVGKPHDHGESWAIYGQATGLTEMTEWRRLDDGKSEHRAELEVAKKFTLTPGVVALFDSGTIHSTAHPQPARWVRVTGTDLDHIRRFRYDPEKHTMSVMNAGT